jgi:hypothetical protein
MRTNNEIRISLLIMGLIIETSILVNVSTKTVAMANPRALTTEFETASKGHNPNSCTKAALSSINLLRINPLIVVALC